MELCQIGANQGLTAEIGWNYTPQDRRCRKILIGLVVRGAKTVVVRGKNRILTQNRKNPEMTVPISNDKSDPEDIKATFGISKGQFKKALGGLMKAKKIKQDELGTELIK